MYIYIICMPSLTSIGDGSWQGPWWHAHPGSPTKHQTLPAQILYISMLHESIICCKTTYQQPQSTSVFSTLRCCACTIQQLMHESTLTAEASAPIQPTPPSSQHETFSAPSPRCSHTARHDAANNGPQSEAEWPELHIIMNGTPCWMNAGYLQALYAQTSARHTIQLQPQRSGDALLTLLIRRPLDELLIIHGKRLQGRLRHPILDSHVYVCLKQAPSPLITWIIILAAAWTSLRSWAKRDSEKVSFDSLIGPGSMAPNSWTLSKAHKRSPKSCDTRHSQVSKPSQPQKFTEGAR